MYELAILVGCSLVPVCFHLNRVVRFRHTLETDPLVSKPSPFYSHWRQTLEQNHPLSTHTGDRPLCLKTIPCLLPLPPEVNPYLRYCNLLISFKDAGEAGSVTQYASSGYGRCLKSCKDQGYKLLLSGLQAVILYQLNFCILILVTKKHSFLH